jgi:hypothetical protein
MDSNISQVTRKQSSNSQTSNKKESSHFLQDKLSPMSPKQTEERKDIFENSDDKYADPDLRPKKSIQK